MLANKVNIQEINMHLPEKYSFICFSSFEQRCLSIPYALNCNCVNRAYVIYNAEAKSIGYNIENTKLIEGQFAEAKLIPVNIQKAMDIAKAMADIVSRLIEEEQRTVIIDISTFTHESLLILMRLLYANKTYFEYVKCLYNGASRYSIGDSLEQMWLSKGCRDVRNVIGYPGKKDSKKRNHLIILTGFEIERATGLVELLSPDILTLGTGSEPTENEHSQVMDYFKSKFERWKDNFVGILNESFEFSCRDVEKTIDILQEKMCNKDENFYIVPLNTKLSTLAVGIAALNNPNIQVCYAIPEIYNMINYSEPSTNVTIVDLDKLFERIRG